MRVGGTVWTVVERVACRCARVGRVTQRVEPERREEHRWRPVDRTGPGRGREGPERVVEGTEESEELDLHIHFSLSTLFSMIV